ncbi:MAG: helix-turn-helix domain-containing protein [Ruminococcaceae bacterium]|nr:helix-turn-helix domain-containing protein [Oscillospiraceae bacterium]
MDYKKFEALLKSNNTTVYKVSKATGIAQSTFSDWKSGRSTPKADKLKKIADHFGVGIGYLMDSETYPISEMSGIDPRGSRKVPIIGEIRAGSPIITNESVIGYEYADVDGIEDYFFLKVKGDSMKNVGMINGSIVLFHKQQYAENGDIVACLVGGECATVKRFWRDHKRVRLIPENEEYEPLELSTDDFEAGEARILGVAVEVKIKL